MKLIITKSTFSILLLIGQLFIVMGEPFGNTFFMSAGTTIIFLSIVGVFVKKILENSILTKADIILFLLIISSICSFVYAGTFTYSKFVPLMCFLEIPILLCSFEYKEFKVEKKIYILYYVISLWYIFLSFSDVAYIYYGEYGETYIDQLTLGFNNPNQTAMYLCFTFFVLIIAVYKVEKRFFRFILLINSFVMIWLILKTQSRAAIAIIIIFGFFVLVKKHSTLNKFFKNKSLIIPLLFAFFILFFGDLYADLMFLNEEFDTGRLSIFENALGSLKSTGNLIFGNYAIYAQQNLHNIIISVLVEYGVFVLVLFFLFYNEKVKQAYHYISTKPTGIAFFAVLLIFTYASVEAAFFISGSFYAVSFFSLYYLCLPGKETKNKECVK